MSGTSLGPYKIIEQIGAGGMGDLYRAGNVFLRNYREAPIRVSRVFVTDREHSRMQVFD